MKCEKCNKNEAVVFYKENINGEKREMRLCADCAREEGITDRFLPERMDEFFDGAFRPFFPMERMFFAPMTRALPGLMFLPDYRMGRPRPHGHKPGEHCGPHGEHRPRKDGECCRDQKHGEKAAEEQKAPAAQETAAPVSDEAAELRMLREQNLLRRQLSEAVAKEDYEQAILLRDQLRRLENNP